MSLKHDENDFYTITVSMVGPDVTPTYGRLTVTGEMIRALKDGRPEAREGLEWQLGIMVRDILNGEFTSESN